MPQALFMCVGWPASRRNRPFSCVTRPVSTPRHVSASSPAISSMLRPVESFSVLTFPSEVCILFAEGFGSNTPERLAAEKEAALITFFFAHPAGRTGTICHLRRFGSEAYRHRLCSGLWLFAFRTGTANCVSYRYQPFGASLLCFGFTFPCQLVDAPAGGKLLALDIQGIS